MDLLRFREVFSASLQITEVVPVDATPREIRAGRATMPPEGSRSNLVVQGTVGGEINGMLDGIDYYTLSASGEGHSHAHAILTTDDGRRLDVRIDGIARPMPAQQRLSLRQTWQLHATDPTLAWVNGEPFFVVGETNLESYAIELTAYAAMQEMATYG